MFEGLSLNLNIFKAQKEKAENDIVSKPSEKKESEPKKMIADQKFTGSIFDKIQPVAQNTSSDSSKKRDNKANLKPQNNIELVSFQNLNESKHNCKIDI